MLDLRKSNMLDLRKSNKLDLCKSNKLDLLSKILPLFPVQDTICFATHGREKKQILVSSVLFYFLDRTWLYFCIFFF